MKLKIWTAIVVQNSGRNEQRLAEVDIEIDSPDDVQFTTAGMGGGGVSKPNGKVLVNPNTVVAMKYVND